MAVQILFGTVLLMLCALTHIAAVAVSLPLFPRLGKALDRQKQRHRIAAFLCFGLLVIVTAHTIQIWAWALVLHIAGAFAAFSASFYFATVTYTTLGYGDLVLSDDLRIFATFASITGLLTFGISTAFLLGLIVRIIPAAFEK